jgi:hypothetical protein
MTTIQWTVFKDYRSASGSDMVDTWCILYGTKAEADAAKQRLETGYDKSWFDPDGNDYAGYDAILYVDSFLT